MRIRLVAPFLLAAACATSSATTSSPASPAPAAVAAPTLDRCTSAVDHKAALLDQIAETRDVASQIKSQRQKLGEDCVAHASTKDVDCVLGASNANEVLACSGKIGELGAVAAQPAQ